MNLEVNGQRHLHRGSGSIPELIAEMGANPAAIAVIVNGDVVPRARWQGCRLAENDQVELLVMAAGG